MKELSLLLFLKEKQTGQIKGQACINGAPQREYIPKEEAASPTVSIVQVADGTIDLIWRIITGNTAMEEVATCLTASFRGTEVRGIRMHIEHHVLEP
jgi:hypothetical protein